MARLQPLILEWLSKPGNNRGILSELSGVPVRRIYCILRGYDMTRYGPTTNVTLDTADRLLIGMDMMDRWWSELDDIYEVA